MNNLKSKMQGITLIALIITIISLIIIAGVAITFSLGDNGIIKRTTNARDEYEISKEKEELELLIGKYTGEYFEKKSNGNELVPENFSTFLAEKLDGQVVDGYHVSVNGKRITLSKGKETLVGRIKDDGSIIWGDFWEFATINGEKIVTNGKQEIKIGDYVRYNPIKGATQTSVTSYASENGYKDQTFELSSLGIYTGTGWRVLGVNETGNILIISDTAVTPKDKYGFKMYNYQNGISELNKISDLYGHGKYAIGARSVNADDINKLTGYESDDSDDLYYSYNIGERVGQDSIAFSNTNNVIGDREGRDGRSGFNGTTSYWLATEFVRHFNWRGYEGENHGIFGVRNNGWLFTPDYDVDGDEIGESWSEEKGVRPVVILQSDVQLKKELLSREWKFLDVEYDEIKIGDYVNYNPEDGATQNSITSYESVNGNSNQTFLLADGGIKTGIGWRVFDVNDSGSILLVSDDIINPVEKDGYTINRFIENANGSEINKIVDEINKICSLYGHGKHAISARSFNIKDVNKLVGFDKKHDWQFYFIDKQWYYYNIYDMNTDDISRSLVLIAGEGADSRVSQNYERGFTSITKSYWLASSFFTKYSWRSYNGSRYGLFSVIETGKVYSGWPYFDEGDNGSGWGGSRGIRPVITIDPYAELRKNPISGEWDFVD